MNNFETYNNENKELNEIEKQREILYTTANQLLLDEKNQLTVIEEKNPHLVVEQLIKNFQETIRNFYQKSGLEQKISSCNSPDEVLTVIVESCAGTHAWHDMLPNLKQRDANAGLNCTMSSAMLHLGLEQIGEKNIHTVIVPGHSQVIQQHTDGGITIFDASSTSNETGTTKGYQKTFSKDQILNWQPINEYSVKQGFSCTIRSLEADVQGGFTPSDGVMNQWEKHLLAFTPSILMHPTTALTNLECMKADAEKLGGAAELGFIDEGSYLRALYEYIQQANEQPLSAEEWQLIRETHPRLKEEIIAAANLHASEVNASLDPFDFIQHPLIHKAHTNLVPPRLTEHMENTQLRHREAKAILTEFPRLKELQLDELKKVFPLFNPNEFIKNSIP